ncbi:MAG TPA: M20/M25/M40 family metallo-hydrolase [Candidatus Saccharimonadales bacterium]|nr:M20/M25/M40 family metallo-hydrolase [Candidatus Saccharimonadales bacterium]
MRHGDTLEAILADLVAFRTITGDHDAAMGCIGYAEAYLKSRGMKVSRHKHGGFPSLVATTRRTKEPKLLLQAHLDVVAAPDHCFKLTKKDGKFFGRGVYDMKFAAAIFLKLVDDLRDRLAGYDFGIMFTSDEEIGGQDGVKSLLDAGYGAQVCLLPDAGGPWKIETSHKGCWIGQVTAQGQAAHGSRPWEGDNAIDRLVDALRDIRKMFDGQHEDSDTLSINRIVGGAVVNQVADKAEATLDLRFVDDDSYERTLKKIKKLAELHRVSVTTYRLIKVSRTDAGHPLVLPYLRIAEKVRGEPLGHVRSLGISDAHFFADKGIPVILSRPNGGCAHGDDEWIDKKDLDEYYRVVKAYVEEVCAEA